MEKIDLQKLNKNIGLSAEACRTAELAFGKYAKTISLFADRIYKSENTAFLKRLATVFPEKYGAVALCVMLSLTERAASEYENKGLPEQVFFDTMQDIAVWERVFFTETGFHGLSEINWLINHIKLKIFKIGRLQFQPIEKMKNPTGTAVLPDFFNCLNVHIPRGEPLKKELCEASLASAEEFFKEYYPEFSFDYFFCHSWLLSREMPLMAKENTNMYAFWSMWKKVGYSENSNQPFEYVWSKKPTHIALLSENTTLQRNVKKILLSGKGISEGYGYIEKTDCIK